MVLEAHFEVFQHLAASWVSDVEHLAAETLLHHVTEGCGVVRWLGRTNRLIGVRRHKELSRKEVESLDVRVSQVADRLWSTALERMAGNHLWMRVV